MADNLTDAQKVMAEVLAAHYAHPCEFYGDELEAWAATTAVAVDEALGGLTRESTEGERVGDDPRLEPSLSESRFVGGWTPEEKTP